MNRLTRGWVLALVGMVAMGLVCLAAWSWSRPDPVAAEDAGRAAQEVAERAIIPIVSYDYRTLDSDKKDADSYLTGRYRAEEFDPLWATIKENAATSQTVITARVVGSGLVHTTPDRVQVLVLVNRPTSNAGTTEPVVYEDHVTLTMVRSGDTWLVDGLTTG